MFVIYRGGQYPTQSTSGYKGVTKKAATSAGVKRKSKKMVTGIIKPKPVRITRTAT
jgi:hypothetical protein